MTLRSSDLQSDSDLDSIRNSCDVWTTKRDFCLTCSCASGQVGWEPSLCATLLSFPVKKFLPSSDLTSQWRDTLIHLQCQRSSGGATFWKLQTVGGLQRRPQRANTMCREVSTCQTRRSCQTRCWRSWRRRRTRSTWRSSSTSTTTWSSWTSSRSSCTPWQTTRTGRKGQFPSLRSKTWCQSCLGGWSATHRGVFQTFPPFFSCFVNVLRSVQVSSEVFFQTSLHNFMFYRCSKISPGSKEFYAYVIFHVLKVSLKDVSRFPYWRGWPDPRNVQLLEAMEAKNISGDFNVTKILTKSSSIYH